MAAYAALVSLMNIIHDIQHHHSPPISIHNQQAQSLTQTIDSLQQFLETHNTSFVTEIDEANPLEMRIANAACAAEDIIESHIVNRILTENISFSVDATHRNLPENIPISEDATRQILPENNPFSEDATHRILPERTLINLLHTAARVTPYETFIFLKRSASVLLFPWRHHPINQSVTQTLAYLLHETHLEMQIADSAYAAEDLTESHIVNEILPENIPFDDQTSIPFSEVSSHHDETKLYEELQPVLDEMESIKKQMVEIDAEKEVVHHHQRQRVVDAFAAPSKSYSNRHNSIMVCSDDIIKVMEKLVNESLGCHRHVIPIVGMGGIGKTTLSKYIYGQPFIKEYFDICAWATISQQYNAKEILCELLCQATNKEREPSEKSENELGMELYQYLFRRRYLIVMDDMWTVDVWNRIQHFFPDNENGSRVLVTTRLSQLISQLNGSYSHDMQFLDKVSSWDLFSKIVFGEKSCPDELKDIGEEIVENCRGLPLSIVVVGGILKKMEYTRGSWESIGKNITSLVNLDNDKYSLRLLSLSYIHLPAYLKPCFLYMGVFEEDTEIKVSTLIKLWIGEGFLKPIHDESLEAIGKGFLKELVDRNLILVHRLGSTGNVKYCKIHDLLRDFCLSEGKKDGFYHVIGHDSPQGIRRQRRVVIPRNTSENKVLDDLRSMSHVRSVISEYGKVPLCKNLRLVSELHANKYRGKINVDLDAFKYVNLRHLAVRVDRMSSFFSSITLHWNLHTLIVSSTRDSFAPVEIWRMPQFRRIEFVKTQLFLPDPPKDTDVVVMKNLQTLMGVMNFKLGEGAIERIPNMKKLRMRYSGRFGFEDEYYYRYSFMRHQCVSVSCDCYCLSNIERLCNLESLCLSFWSDFERVDSLNMLTFPHSLKKLSLSISPEFKWEGMLKKVGLLPLLEKLELWNGGGFRSGEWKIAEGQFPCLKYLGIVSFSDLRKMTTTQNSIIFPRLECLYLKGLKALEEIPYEIGEIMTLQKIEMVQCGSSVVMRAKEILDEQIESQGDVSFNVVVSLLSKNEELLSLAGPNFLVVFD